MSYCLKVYREGPEILVAVCDADLIGKTFVEGELILEITENFYGNATVTREEVIRALKMATIANITGEKSVQCAIEANIIDEDKVLRVQNVPHAQMVRI